MVKSCCTQVIEFCLYYSTFARGSQEAGLVAGHKCAPRDASFQRELVQHGLFLFPYRLLVTGPVFPRYGLPLFHVHPHSDALLRRPWFNLGNIFSEAMR